MRLAGAAVAESNNIVVGDDIFTTVQFGNERLVERWNCSEVERIETLHRGKAGGADAALDHAPFAIDEFELGESSRLPHTGLSKTSRRNCFAFHPKSLAVAEGHKDGGSPDCLIPDDA